jgi:hypothetical protein
MSTLMLLLPAWGAGADAPGSRSQGQMETTIIHVDKYAVYGPNLVFYWDPAAGKQRVATLTGMAERLRNKRATITYSTVSDLNKDKRPYLVDITPPGQEPPSTTASAQSSEAVSKPAPGMTPEEPSKRPRGADPGGDADPTLTGRAREPEPVKSFDSAGGPITPITKAELTAFIERCMDAARNKDLAGSLRCYADQVDYYSKGLVNKDFIRKDKGYYFRNWDRVDSWLEGDVVVIIIDQPDLRIAKFVTGFEVENSKTSVRGRAENLWKVQKIGNELKIVDEKQKIIRRDEG